jgi:hypothetical protein
MKSSWKTVLIMLVVLVGVFIGAEIYKAWRAGTTAVKDLLLAPWNTLKSAWSTASKAAASVASDVSAAAELPQLTQTELQNAQNQESIAASYQPGGTMYNVILATQGQAAADNAAQTAADNAAIELQQAQADSSGWGFGNLYSYL